MHRILKTQTGFTLTELMVVLAIIAIGSAIAVPIFLTSLPHHSVRGSARGLISDLRLAQGIAVKQGTPYQIVFDVDNDTYEIQCVDGNTPPCSPDPLPPVRELGKPGRRSIDLVSVVDLTPTDQGLIRYGGSGAVVVPSGNFPITVRLESKETEEPILVQLSRGGRLQTIVP